MILSFQSAVFTNEHGILTQEIHLTKKKGEEYYLDLCTVTSSLFLYAILSLHFYDTDIAIQSGQSFRKYSTNYIDIVESIFRTFHNSMVYQLSYL